MESMRLFLDHYPFREHVSESDPTDVLFDPLLPIYVTNPKILVPPDPRMVRYRDWPFDSCYTGQGVASSNFLLESYGLRLKRIAERITPGDNEYLPQEYGKTLKISSAHGSSEGVLLYRARFWLMSNVSEFSGLACPISVTELGDSSIRRVIGRKAFFGTGIKIELHFDDPTPSTSVWVPESLTNLVAKAVG